jgi:hypothetical protein
MSFFYKKLNVAYDNLDTCGKGKAVKKRSKSTFRAEETVENAAQR